MTLYLFVGGGYISADCADVFVAKMRDLSLFSTALDTHSYMCDVADRCMSYSKSIIRTDSTDNFLQDLIDSRFVVKIGGVV
jgi:hypothetical protein